MEFDTEDQVLFLFFLVSMSPFCFPRGSTFSQTGEGGGGSYSNLWVEWDCLGLKVLQSIHFQVQVSHLLHPNSAVQSHWLPNIGSDQCVINWVIFKPRFYSPCSSDGGSKGSFGNCWLVIFFHFSSIVIWHFSIHRIRWGKLWIGPNWNWIGKFDGRNLRPENWLRQNWNKRKIWLFIVLTIIEGTRKMNINQSTNY